MLFILSNSKVSQRVDRMRLKQGIVFNVVWDPGEKRIYTQLAKLFLEK